MGSEVTEPIEPISERQDSLDFHSEYLSTNHEDSSSKAQDYLSRVEHMNQTDRNRWFHEAMNHFQSIVVQPKGKNLERSAKLDTPVFYLRHMPVKEQYKQALKKIEEVTHPEKFAKDKKPEKSVANMMLSSNGSLLDLQKQMT